MSDLPKWCDNFKTHEPHRLAEGEVCLGAWDESEGLPPLDRVIAYDWNDNGVLKRLHPSDVMIVWVGDRSERMTDRDDRCAACGHPASKHAVHHCEAWYDNDTPCKCEEFAKLVKPTPTYGWVNVDGVPTSAQVVEADNINHPSHYNQYKGVEVIDLTEQMNFNLGNAVKYICRAGFKDPEKLVEDLMKARWYLDREIERISKNTTPCRRMETRNCPKSYTNGCGDRPCARFESDDEGPWKTYSNPQDGDVNIWGTPIKET